MESINFPMTAYSCRYLVSAGCCGTYFVIMCILFMHCASMILPAE